MRGNWFLRKFVNFKVVAIWNQCVLITSDFLGFFCRCCEQSLESALTTISNRYNDCNWTIKSEEFRPTCNEWITLYTRKALYMHFFHSPPKTLSPKIMCNYVVKGYQCIYTKTDIRSISFKTSFPTHENDHTTFTCSIS